MKTILLLTDFSKNSLNAIMYALELYKTERCKFYVLNVFKTTYNIIDDIIPPKPGEEGYDVPKNKSSEGLARISTLINFKEDQNPYHNFTYLSLNTPLLKAIEDMVEEKDIEMVIMGTKGISDNESPAFGSNAVQVMENIRNCPVLVIPKKAKHKLPKEIVFPTSFKTHYKKRELNYLIDIAIASGSSIKILYVGDETELDKNQLEHKKMLETYFNNISYSFHTLSCVSVSTAVKCFAESRESDMITFINKKHSFFESILTQPLVKDINYNLKIPVLVLHDLRN